MITWEKSVAQLAVSILIALSLALVTLFLVIDFGDWLRIYTGRPVSDVVELYWFRSHLALVQFAPAALVLTGGLTITIIRRRGEWTALKALGASPTSVLRPVVAVCLAGTIGLLAFQEFVVSHSGPRVDRMMVERFDRGWGDFLSNYTPRRWFRTGAWLVNVRGEANPERLDDVRLFEISADGRLQRWLEGAHLTFVSEGKWKLDGASELALRGAEVRSIIANGEFELSLPLRPEITRLAVGRPEWLPLRVLGEQVGVMGSLQLPTEATRFAIHHRWAAPFAAVLAALITGLISLVSRTRPSVPLALISGGLLYGLLFILGMIARSLALNGHVNPAFAAWIVPIVLLSVIVPLSRRVWRAA